MLTRECQSAQWAKRRKVRRQLGRGRTKMDWDESLGNDSRGREFSCRPSTVNSV